MYKYLVAALFIYIFILAGVTVNMWMDHEQDSFNQIKNSLLIKEKYLDNY